MALWPLAFGLMALSIDVIILPAKARALSWIQTVTLRAVFLLARGKLTEEKGLEGKMPVCSGLPPVNELLFFVTFFFMQCCHSGFRH